MTANERSEHFKTVREALEHAKKLLGPRFDVMDGIASLDALEADSPNVEDVCRICGRGVERHLPDGYCNDVEYAGGQRWCDSLSESDESYKAFVQRWQAAKLRNAPASGKRP